MLKIEMTKPNIDTGIEHSSKGNQLKWEQDGWWYKADAFGFESLAETVVSKMLEKSNLTDFVRYEPVTLIYREKEYRGCRSRNFKNEREDLIPLERLCRNFTGAGLSKQLSRIFDVKERLKYTEELVRTATGLDDFGEYLTKLLEIDAFFLNEDRHTNNIALLYDLDTKEYRVCPFFDMGLSLFSDTRESYPPEKDFYECRRKIEAKPFHRDFDEQLDAANELFGQYLRFLNPEISIEGILEELAQEKMYTQAERKRAEEVLRYQKKKYQYLFVKKFT